jgi:hypothetical protein
VLRNYIAPETFNTNHTKDNRSFGHEPFLPSDTPVESISAVIDEFNSAPCFVMKTQFNEIEHLFNNGFLEKFKSLNTYNIMLMRKDVFEAALSLSVAITKNEFINFKNFDEITIDCGMLIHMVDFLLTGYEQLINNVWNLVYNEIVYYEDLVFTPKLDFEYTQLYRSSPGIIEECVLDKCEYKAPKKELTVKNYSELKSFVINYLSQKTIKGVKIDGTQLRII